MSLFQKGPNGEERTAVELTVFKKSLSNMMEWYAHPWCTRSSSRAPPGLPDRLQISTGRGAQPGGLHQQGLVLLRVVGQQPDQAIDMVLDLGKFDEESMKDCPAVHKGVHRKS